MKKELKDTTIKALKAKAAPYEVMDRDVPGFGVRVMPSGKKSFILLRRFSSSNPTRRLLGHYRELVLDADGGFVEFTLARAREKARQWNAMLKAGLDPAVEEDRRRQAKAEAARKKADATFGKGLDAYLKHKSKLRSAHEMGRNLRREFKGWEDRPLADIGRREVEDIINGIVARGHTATAHAIFALVRGFFNWVCARHEYGIKESPCKDILPSALIGDRNIRQRTLTDHEIAAFWRACGRLDYPFGPLFRLLLLTACRLTAVSEARWSEVNFEGTIYWDKKAAAEGAWTVPAFRMKGREGKVGPHLIPLTEDILALLQGLPRFGGAGFIFTTTAGRVPVGGFSKAKKKLDVLMAEDLEAQGRQFEDFVLHDLRRTARTKFSALPVEDVVREALLAHARPGLDKIYNLHTYEGEKAYALKLWHDRLRAIVEPPSPAADNVFRFTRTV